MAYPMQNPYQGYFQQFPQFQQMQQAQPPIMPQPQQQAPQGGIIWVSSMLEAQQYLMTPNSAVTLWDSNSPTVYLKQTDASGKPSMKIYDLVERTTSASAASSEAMNKYATVEALNALAERVDALDAKRVRVRKVDEE